MFGASSELVRSWLRTSQCNGIWHEPASNMFGASSELASVMEFGFYHSFYRPDILPDAKQQCRKHWRQIFANEEENYID